MSEATQDPKQTQTEGEDLTFGDIVWVQFKKNRVSYGALWMLGLLFLLAIVAPLLASERPFLWNDGTGLTMPWFSSLFDRNYFENPVDIFFNLILVVGGPLGLIVWAWVRRLRTQPLSKRARRRKSSG